MKKTLLFALALTVAAPQMAYASYTDEEIESAVEGIYNQKCAGEGDYMSSAQFCDQAGTSSNTDWYAFLAGYLGCNGEGYIEELSSYIEDWYDNTDLTSANPTEWARMSLAMLSLGYDPSLARIHEDDYVDLIGDGTWNHEKYLALSDTLINGLDFELISLDAYSEVYGETHEDYVEELISSILALECADGGFGISGSDIDLTAMTVTALSPHMDEPEVAECVERSVSWLSACQKDNGMYVSCGVENAESAAQVIIALCSAGIDPQTDERFIKNGESVLDALMTFRQEDGGFAHAITEHTKSNALASIQAGEALIAVYKLDKGMGRLYSFSDTDIFGKEVETSENTAEETVTEMVTTEKAASETIKQTETDTEAQVYEENTEQLQSVPGEETADNGNLVYIVAGIVVLLIILAVVVMRKVGRDEEEK